MGNSTSLGQGGSEARDTRDIDGDEFKDGRPPEITKLADEKSDISRRTIEFEPSTDAPDHGIYCTFNIATFSSSHSKQAYNNANNALLRLYTTNINLH